MKRALMFAAAFAASSSLHAAGIGIRAGTTGIGGDVAFNLAPTIDARVGYSALKWGHDVDTSNVSYKGDAKLSNLNALLDFHPLGPIFRLTGGVILNDNKYEATGRPSNGGPGTINAKVEAGNRAAPYLGVGWGNVAGAGVNFYADLGVMFMGSPKATLSADCTGLSAGQCSALQSQTASEQGALEDKLHRFKAYPVLNIGITIGF
ncbi:MAG: hypothetical protein JF611_15890 [Betaproteobacteria bacterium]|jgi:hypothetical protein|nr:hypothetical protein [Betaproteobacteria bacterium]